MWLLVLLFSLFINNADSGKRKLIRYSLKMTCQIWYVEVFCYFKPITGRKTDDVIGVCEPQPSAVWCWSSVSPHRAIVNLPQPSGMLVLCVSPWCCCQPASTQCDVGPVCVPIELLSTCLNPV